MNETIIETTSLPFAAALMTLGKTCAGAKKHSKKDWLRVFMFEDDGTIDDLQTEFTNRQLTVEPQAYWENVRNLKDLPVEGEV